MVKNTKIKVVGKINANYNQIPNAESLENKIRKMLISNEPIKMDITPIWTERKDGVMPQYDIRTDRWEIALEASERITKSQLAARQQRYEAKMQQQQQPKEPKTE